MSVHPITAVKAHTPHRHPMLMLDRLESLLPGQRGSAVKAVSQGEAHREGGGLQHGLPVSLLVDALGQLAIAILSAPAARKPQRFYLSALEDVQWQALPAPGDVIRLNAELLRSWRGTSKVAVAASVGGATCLKGVMVLTAVPDGPTPADGVAA